jgi:hypothetical protein
LPQHSGVHVDQAFDIQAALSQPVRTKSVQELVVLLQHSNVQHQVLLARRKSYISLGEAVEAPEVVLDRQDLRVGEAGA